MRNSFKFWYKETATNYQKKYVDKKNLILGRVKGRVVVVVAAAVVVVVWLGGGSLYPHILFEGHCAVR